jgi:hypothetical protein
MPSQYWAGRFQGLHDRFRNEILSKDKLEGLIAVHAAKPSSKHSHPTPAQIPPAHPSTSIFTPSRPKPGRLGMPPSKSASRIPTSKTSSAILQPNSTAQATTAISSIPLHAATTYTIPAAPPPSSPSQWKTIAQHQDNSLLLDDDNRCRRVFLHLEALCTSPEAVASLHVWQQAYARKVGKEVLLPKGGTMKDVRERSSGIVARLFAGNGGNASRRSAGVVERSATTIGLGRLSGKVTREGRRKRTSVF